MPTADRKINIYPKRLLSLTGIKDNFLDFLLRTIEEVTAGIFIGISGVLDSDPILINSVANDTFELDISQAWRVVVGGGQIIDMSLLNGAGITSAIPFENNTGTTYSVGIKYAEVPDGIELNPRTGDPEYPSLKQTYGEVDYPDDVDDQTTYIRVRVNSVTGANEDHSGRTCRVWLVDPVSPIEGPAATAAYYEGTIAYASPNNYVDIPYSGALGPLGQDTSGGPPSQIATEYRVFVEGVTWRNKANKDLSTDSDYAFIGEITGNGPSATPTVFDTSGQVPVFINTLDRAYDGATGSGSGRIVNVDSGAVELKSRTGSGDDMFTTLRVDRKGGTENGGVGVLTISDERDGSEAGQLHVVPLTHSTGNLIIDNPCSTTSPDIVTRTGSVDWAASNVNIRMDLAWLQGFSTVPNGLYTILVVAATTLQLRELDGGTPAFGAGDTGNVTILRVQQITNPKFWGSASNAIIHGAGGTAFHGPNESLGPPSGNGGDDSYAAAIFYGDAADHIKFYESYEAAPKVATWINKEGALKTFQQLIIAPTRDMQVQASGAVGLGLVASGINGTTALDWFTGSGDLLEEINDPTGQIVGILEPYGIRATPHHFKDDFHYNQSSPTGWTSNTTCPKQYKVTATGSATVTQQGSLVGVAQMAHGGAARFANTAATESVQLEGPSIFWLDTSKLYLVFKARMAIDNVLLSDRTNWIGFDDVAGNYRIKFELDNNVHGNQNYWLVVDDGTNPTEKVDTGFGPQFSSGNPLYTNFYFAITGHQTIRYYTSDMSAPATKTLSTITFNGANGLLRPQAYQDNLDDPTAIQMWLDLWEVSDNEVVAVTLGREVY